MSTQVSILIPLSARSRSLHGVVLVGLLLLSFAASASAAELPGERLGHPVRTHIARGLWWQMLGLHDALGYLGGAELSASVDVYGNPSGYHGCAQTLGTFPGTRQQLGEQDLIVLAGIRVIALPLPAQTALAAWVRAGGGLLITGGPLSLDQDTYGPLAEILPVTIAKKPALSQVAGAVLQPVAGSGLESFDWSGKPRVYWLHAGVRPKPDSQVLLQAGEAPLLVMGKAGKGRVAVFSGTVCGDPVADETAFWDWPTWPQLLGTVLARLAPTAAIALPTETMPQAKAGPALKRLAVVADTGLDMMDDLFDGSEGLGAQDTVGAKDGLGAELTELAGLTRNADFAQALVKATAESRARLSPAQATAIFQAVAPYLTPEAAAASSGDLIESGTPGTVALGLRLAGLANQRETGPTMVKFVAQGLAGLPADAPTATAAIPGMRVPDGQDEALRLAAAEALADLADPALIDSLRKAVKAWQDTRDKTPMLAAKQRDLEEMAMAALAAMGDPDAAVWVVDRLIGNTWARETAIDISEHRGRNPSEADLRERRQAAEEAVRLVHRNRRLRRALHRLPTAAWPGLAAKAPHWQSEFAAEALLLALAAGDSDAHTPAARAALEMIDKATTIPAVRNLCRTRLARK